MISLQEISNKVELSIFGEAVYHRARFRNNQQMRERYADCAGPPMFELTDESIGRALVRLFADCWASEP